MQTKIHSWIWAVYCFLCWNMGQVTAQVPTLTNTAPTEAFIGEQFCFPITFAHTGAPGYGPYVRLILPDGFSFDQATFSGAVQSVQNLGTIGAGVGNNFVIDPIAQSNTSSTANDTIFAAAGSTVFLLEYPVGSMVQGGVSLVSNICVTINNTATVGVPEDVCVQGMYEFGDTPTGTNGTIAGANICVPVVPSLFLFNKQINGSGTLLGTVPGGGTGSCHIGQYQLNVDIAGGGTLNGPIVFTDVLPADLIYLGNISLPAGCTANEPPIGSTGGTLTVNCSGNYTGSTANIDMQVSFDIAGDDVLDETICDGRNIENIASINAGGTTMVDTARSRITHVHLEHENNTSAAVVVGQTVQYTINVDITEYTAGLNTASITFVVPDGMVYNPTSLTFGGLAVAPANVSITAGPGTGSTVTVDILAQHGSNILPCASSMLQYTADVNQTYNNGRPVLSRDELTHTSTINYSLVEGATGCTSTDGTSIDIRDISFQKTVNNSPPTGAGRNGQWWPGDVVQYRLELQIPSLDLDDVVITDFFPLPIHNVADLAATFGTDVRFDPASCWTNAPLSYVRDVATNSLILDFGDLSDAITGGCVDVVLLIDIPITTVPFADGLMHSNFMQVNSDNSAVDDVSNNSFTLIQVGAPDLELTKGVVSSNNPNVVISPMVSPPNGNASNVNAGDQLFFDITVENTGTAAGYDVQIRDVVPAALTNCALVAPTPVVDGNNNAVAFTGGFVGNSLTITLAAPNDSIAFANAPSNNDLIRVSYVCEASTTLAAGILLENTAEVDWASERGGSKFSPDQDEATVRAENPTIRKAVEAILPNYSGTTTRATIGEVIAYEVQVTIPEGNLNNVTLVDQLDEGLAMVGVDSVIVSNSSGSANISTSIAGGFGAIQAAAAISDLGANPEQQDRVLTLDFGNLQNLDTDNIQDTIKIYYKTIVINHSTNIDGERVRNRARLEWDNPNTVGNRSSITGRADFVTIVEPQLEVVKSFTPTEVLPGNNAFVTITVRNPSTAAMPAFDVSLTDLLPTGMTFVSGFSAGGTASITTPPTQGGGSITAHWDTINVGEIYSMTFEVQVSSSISPCYTLTNCANITWESIAEADEPNMPTAFSSNLGVKRSGNTGALGGLANTYTQDSCANLDVVIDNSFDPFITANTPLCVGDRAVLSVQQYNGNVVRYNWFGPGVPAGFNNYELVLDPVTTADTGVYYVYVELDGCVTDTSNFFVLELRPKPAAPTIVPHDSTVCEGEGIQFTTTGTATSYTWTGPNGFSANAATTPLIFPVTFADAGMYTLFTTNSQGCRSDLVSTTLNVRPRPAQPSFSNNTPICSGDSMVLIANTTAASYQWIGPNGQDTITSNNRLAISANSTFYLAGNWTLVVIDANGCASLASTPVAIQINSTPSSPIVANSGPICEGQDVTLMVNSVLGATYAWYTDAALSNLVATTQNPTLSGLTAANAPDTFYVQINNNGCLSNTGRTIVEVHSNTTVVTPSYTPVCSGDSIFLFSNTTATSYQWTGPNGFVSNTSNPVIANSSALNAGSYTLQITDTNSCQAIGIVQVAVEERPNTPVLTANAVVCEGENISLTTMAYTGTTVQYIWTSPTGGQTTGVPALTINNVTNADSGWYSLRVLVDACTSLTDSVFIRVQPNPSAPNVPANFSVCEGESIPLGTTTIANAYQWTGPNGFSSTSPNPAAISPATLADGGSYTLQIEDINGCQSPTATTVVTINTLPSIPALTSNTPICMGDTLSLSTTVVATAYIWTGPNGADTTTTTNTVVMLPSNSLYQGGAWTLEVVNANACTSATSIPVVVDILSLPTTPTATNNGPICRGENVQLSVGNISGATYTWYTDSNGNQPFSTLQNPVVNNINQDTTFYVIVRVNGCAANIDSTNVLVHPPSVAPNVPANFSICEGEQIVLSTTTNASTYQWTGPNGFVSTLQNPTVITNATGLNAGLYNLIVTDGNGCLSPDASVLVSVNARPARPAMTNNTPICRGTNLILNTTAVATAYRWIAPNGADTTTTSNNITISPTSSLYQAGNWTLVVVDMNGCSSLAAIASTVEINTGVAITAFNNGPVCNGSMVTLNATSLNAALYQWYSDSTQTNLISTQQNPTISNISQDSTFYLVVTTNACPSEIVSTTVLVHAIPPSPSLPANFAVCAGEAIVLSTPTIANAYQWTGPNGFVSTLQNPTVITPATSADAGSYTLSILDANGCSSPDSSVVVMVNSAPAAPILTNNSAICAGDTLLLSTTANADSFYWTSPNGIDTITTVGTLTILPSNSTYYQSGDWYLRTQVANNCPSEPSNASSVVINSTTTQPIIHQTGPVCIGGNVTLSTANAAGALYQWYTDAALSNLIANTASFVLNNITQDSTLYLVVTVNGCTSPSAMTTIQVIGQPAAPAVPADFAVCEGETIVLSTTTVASSYQWTGPNGFVSTVQYPTAITNATTADAGTYHLVVVDANGCTSADTSVQVVVNSNPAIPTIASNSPLCFGDTLQLFSSATCGQVQWIGPSGNSATTLGTPGGGNVLWTMVNSTQIAANNPHYLPGDWAMICIDTLTGCRSESVATSVAIHANPDTPKVFNTGPVCIGETAQLSTAFIAGASYAWYADSMLTNLVSTQQNPSIVNITTDTTWYLVVQVNHCRSVAGASTVGVYPEPLAPNLPADFAICEGGNLTLSTTTTAMGYTWTGPNGFTSNVQNPLVITNASSIHEGSYTLFITNSNGCVSADTSVYITVNSAPPIPTLTSNSPLCFGDTLELSSSAACGQVQWIGPNGNSAATLGSPGGGNVLWTIGTNTAIPPSSSHYLSGSWTMICIDTLTGCRSESNPITIEINPIPTIAAFNNGPICAGETANLEATLVTGATYAWYSDATRTNLIANTRTVALSNLSQTTTYYVEATLNGCTSLMDSTTLIVHPVPASPTPTFDPLCQLDTLFLYANASGNISNYWWTGPNGFVSNLVNPIIPNISPLQAGSYLLTITDSLGCQAASTVEVSIYPKPQTPTIGNNAPFCEGTQDLILTTQAYFGTDVRYIWTRPNGTIDTTLVPTLMIPNAMQIDTGNYGLSVWVDGCLSLPASSFVQIYPQPMKPAVPTDIVLCEGENLVLGTTTNAATYAWAGPNGFQSNLANPTVLSATLVDSGQYTLKVANVWGCYSLDTSLQVSINANPPIPTIASNSPLCFGDTLNLFSSATCGQVQWIGPHGNSASTLGSPGGGNVLWTLGNSTQIAATNANYLSGNWSMICIDTLTGCRSESSSITIDIVPVPATPAAFNNGPVCTGNAVQLTTATISGASYAWYADSLQTTLVATSQHPTIQNITKDTTFYLVVTVNGCTSLMGATSVQVYPTSPAPSVPANFAVCEGEAIVLSTTTPASSYQWTGPNGFTSSLQQPSIVQATLVDSGTYTLSVLDSNGCQSRDTTVQVMVYANPPQPILTSNSGLCAGDTLHLSTTALGTTYHWIAPDGLDTITTVPSLNIAAFTPYYQAGNWSLRLTNINGCWSPLSALETVVIEQIPPTQAVFNNGPICYGAAINLSTSYINGATYAWYADSLQNTLVATSQNPTIQNITSDTTFYLVVTVNGCRSLAGSTQVILHPQPASPNVPANMVVCEGEPIVLTTTTVANTYQWTGPNGFISFVQSPTAIATASVLDSGVYHLVITDANGCASDDTSVHVTVQPSPSMPIITANNSPICAGDAINLSVNTGGLLGTTYEWFNSSNLSVGVGQNLTIMGATTADAGNYYAVATLNGCNSAASLSTMVVVDTIPTTAAYAGTDINLCNQFSTILDATLPQQATGFWTSNTGATIANPTAANTVVYNLPVGNSTFYWTLSNGACVDFSTDSMVIDLSPASTDVANAGLDQRLCGQTMATLNAVVPASAIGQWTQPASQASQGVVITNASNPSTTVTGLQQGNTYTFTWTLSAGNCMDYSMDAVQIQVDVAPPDHAYAGTNILLCNQNTTSLNAFASQYGTGFWTTNSTATIIDPTLPNSLLTNLPQDTSVLIWTLSNGTCQDYSADTILVVVSTTTDTADAGLNQIVCSGNAVNLAAIAPSSGTGTWSQTAAQAAQGVLIVDVNDPNSQVLGLGTGTTYAFTWTLSNGTCLDYSSDIATITVNATPPDNAYAGADINLCGVTTTANLAASIPTIATGLWTTSSTATISNPTQPNSTVSGLTLGANVFVWTLSAGSCLDYDRDTLVITVTAPSTDVADAGLDSAYCAQTIVRLNARAPSVGGGYWSQTPSQASQGVVIDNPTDTNTTVRNLIAGTSYRFTWTLTNGGCIDYSSDEVIITIDVLPTNVAYAGEDTILCGGNSIQLGALAPPLGMGFWTTNDSATIVTPVDPHSLVVNINEDTTTYYWTLSNGACVDYSSDSIQVVITPVSTDLAFAGYDAVLCGVDSIVLNAGTPTTSTGIWTQSAGQASQGIVISNPTNPSSSVTGIQVGQVYTFTWTLSTTGCPNFSTDDVEYTIHALPAEVAYAGPDIVLCNGNTTTMNATNPIFSTGIWSSNSSSAVIINPTLPNSSIVNLPIDTIEFYWSLSNGSCIDYSVDTMLIIVTPTVNIDTANAGIDIEICNADTVELTALVPTIATGRWVQPAHQASQGVVIADVNTATTMVRGLRLDSTYQFVWSLSNGPCIDYDQDDVQVQVSTLPTDAAYAGDDFVVCGIDTAVVVATAPSIGTGIWTTPSSAIIVTPPSTTTEVLNLGLGNNMLIWTLSNGACRDYSTDTLFITMDTAPIANADSFVIVYNSTGNSIDVLPNDQLNNNWIINITEPISSGQLTNLGTGMFDLILQDVLVDQRFIYQLCNPNCPDVYCDTALVIINVEGGTHCEFPNMITPNNDDANDAFIVPCLDGLEGTKFVVFNRWGDVIYENDNYQNDWKGTHNSAPVPDATYFYLMELADGRKFQGFVEVRR